MLDNQCYTMTEVAKILKVNRSTIWNWTSSGKLKSIKFGTEKRSTVRIRKIDLDEFLNDNTKY